MVPAFRFSIPLRFIEPQKRGRGRKWLDRGAPFLRSFSRNPIMPGVLLIECAPQASGVLWQQSGRRVSCRREPGSFQKARAAGQTLDIEVTLEKEMDAFAQFDACVRGYGADGGESGQGDAGAGPLARRCEVYRDRIGGAWGR